MEILKELRVKMIKSFMEIFILAQLRKNAMSGYDIIVSIHKKFGIMLSSGTVTKADFAEFQKNRYICAR